MARLRVSAATERSLDLGFDEGQQALHDAVAALCRDHCDDALLRREGAFPADAWRAFAELGGFAVAGAEGQGGALERVALFEALGFAAFPGPLLATFFACDVLPEPDRADVAAGGVVVCLGEPPVLPWGLDAERFLEVDAQSGEVWLAKPAGELEAVRTLAGEPAARGALERTTCLGPAAHALLRSDLSRAAYLAAVGRRLLDAACEHARLRSQFGRAIGEFQAVSHPLADSAVALEGAAALARAAAWRCDEDDPEAPAWATAARRSATRAALDAVHVGHQVFGAVGITREGPAFPISRRIREVASLPPAELGATPRLLEAFVPFLDGEGVSG